MNKIGIFSGTFDPIHAGHLKFAEQAIKECVLDRVYFLVEPRPRRKQGVRAFEHRQAMLQLAIKDESKFGSIILKQSRFSPEKTLPLLESRFAGAQLFLLIGDDVLGHLIDWPSVDKLFNCVEFIIGIRNDIEKTEKQIINIRKIKGDSFKYSVFKAEQSKLNSSSIRAVLKHGERPTDIPIEVLNYITQHNLYAESEKIS